MKKPIKILFILNIISYLNNFLFSNIHTYNPKLLNNNFLLYGFWCLSPYILTFITSFILSSDTNPEYEVFKKEALIDWFLRILSYFLVFQEFNFKLLSKEHIYQQISLLSLFILSIFLEYRIYYKSKNCVHIEKNIDVISEEEKINVGKIGQAVSTGMFSWILFIVISISVPSTSSQLEPSVNIVTLIASAIAFLAYIYNDYNKCNLFYLDKPYGNKVFKKNAIYVSIGFLICFTSSLNIIAISENYKNFISFIGLLLSMPSMLNTRKMALRYKMILAEINSEQI